MNKLATARFLKPEKNWFSLILTGMLFSVSLPLGAGQMVGNGGDPIRIRYWKAKDFASQIVLKAQKQSFPKNLDKEVVEWIVKNQEELASDISGTEHVWHKEENTTCAVTHTVTKSPLHFSYPTCKKSNPTQKEMVELLIHESVHHLGIADENFADTVAVALVKAWEKGQLNWYPMPSAQGQLSERMGHSLVWDGEKAIAFGGFQEDQGELNTGAIFSPKEQSWKSISSIGAPKRTRHVALPYQSKMIVWGGYQSFADDTIAWIANGFIYDSATDTWEAIPSNLPEAAQTLRHWSSQVAVLLSDKLFVWGGEEGFNSDVIGGVFDLTTKKWQSISKENAPIRRQGHQAVALDDERVLVWGGNKARRNYSNEGAIYNVKTNSWQPIAQEGAPHARIDHSLVWTGKYAIVFGGDAGSGKLKGSGGVYDPAENKWRRFSSEIAFQRTGHVAIWSGDEMILYGGKVRRSGTLLGAPLAFNPDTLQFRVITSVGGPGSAYQPAGVWASDVMLVIGGQGEDHLYKNSGGILFP